MGAIAFHYSQICSLDFFISGEAIATAETFASAANTRAITGLARVDDLIIPRPTLGTTHGIARLPTTPSVV